MTSVLFTSFDLMVPTWELDDIASSKCTEGIWAVLKSVLPSSDESETYPLYCETHFSAASRAAARLSTSNVIEPVRMSLRSWGIAELAPVAALFFEAENALDSFGSYDEVSAISVIWKVSGSP